jgi:hypothetical protein
MREAAFELQPPARHLDADGAEQGVFVDPPEVGGDKATARSSPVSTR